MIKAPQKASLWWLFTSDGTRRKMSGNNHVRQLWRTYQNPRKSAAL